MAGLGGQLFFRLRRESRIDNLSIDEEEDVIPNLIGLESRPTFVLFLDLFSQFVAYLITDVVDMSSPRGCSNRVDEGDLLKGAIRNRKSYLPPIVRSIVDDA